MSRTVADSARAAISRGRFEEAESICRAALRESQDDVAIISMLGLCCLETGRSAEAVRCFGRAVELSPGDGLLRNNLGTALRAAGHHSEALAAYEAADACGYRSADLMLNLGLLHLEQGNFLRALPFLQWGAAIAPRDGELRYHLAQCSYECVRNEDARRALEGWRDWARNDSLLMAKVATLLLQLGDSPEAESAMAEALLAAADPGPEVLLRYAGLLERLNKVDQAVSVLESVAETLAAQRPDLLEDRQALAARLAERQGDHLVAATAFSKVASAAPAFYKQHPALFAQAKCLDALGRAGEASEVLAQAHASQMDFIRRTAPQFLDPGRRSLAIADHGCDPGDFSRWAGEPGPAPEQSPVFIVAFPRSGTTLLEQMLDAHPALCAMDEQPFLQNAIDALIASGGDYPARLADVSDAQCADARALYWAKVASVVGLKPGQRLVDKNPFNLLRLPAIRRLFPQAHIVVAIRHPCDVILSNYMQHFRAPEVAVMCRDIGSLVDGYVRAFDFWYGQHRFLAPRSQELHYEDLVRNFESIARGLCSFIDLPWRDEMLEPASNARRRGYISTPSYSQVLQPINRRAIGRWHAYQALFEPHLARLMPCFNRWGYSADPSA